MDEMRTQTIHGGLDYEELERLGLRPETILDASVNSNPYGPSPLVRQALAHVPIDRYPDRACVELRRAIHTYEGGRADLGLDALLCGNGTAELIWAIARAFLHQGEKAAVIGPTFGEYSAASCACGATVIAYRAPATERFHVAREAVIAWMLQERPAIVWLCNPNNPTGTWLDQHTLSSLHETCQRMGTVLVVDEAYWRFLVPQEAFSALELVNHSKNAPLLVLRSLTKDCALAGVRLGYAVAAPEVIEQVERYLPSWNVNGFAQAAGIAAMMDHMHRTRTLHDLVGERHAFFHALHELGLPVVPSRTHFCLIDVGDACSIRYRLLRRQMLVRDCTSFGLPAYIRVTTLQRRDWQHVVHALQEVV